MDCNRETILDELNDFEKRMTEISPILEDYLLQIAKTGDIMFPWAKLKPLLRKKLMIVLDDFYETCPTDNLPPLPNVEPFKFDVLRSKILEALDMFHSAPFTIQRLCELLTNPRKHYKRTDKFMRGLEKNVLVVSTVEPRSRHENEVNNNSAAMMNGLLVGINDQPPKKRIATLNVMPEIKLINSAPQFDTFNMISTSASLIISEIPSTSQMEKNDQDGQIANSVDTNIDGGSANSIEIDTGNFREDDFTEEIPCNQHIIHQKSVSSEVSVVMHRSSHSTLENFSIFTSSVVVSDVSTTQENRKFSEGSSDNFKAVIHESQIDLGSFQESCDSSLPEEAIDSSSPSDITERSAYTEEFCDNMSSDSAAIPENKGYFSDMCCQTIPDTDSYPSEIHQKSVEALNESTISDVCDQNISIEDAERVHLKEYSEISNISVRPCEAKVPPFEVPQTHIMQENSVVAICVELSHKNEK